MREEHPENEEKEITTPSQNFIKMTSDVSHLWPSECLSPFFLQRPPEALSHAKMKNEITATKRITMITPPRQLKMESYVLDISSLVIGLVLGRV